jgi:hypothetical protein
MLSEQAMMELARQIAAQEAAAFWPYWLVLLALSFVVAGISGWVAAYLKVRGENFAKKADFDKLLEQLKKQTDATETIKTAIAQAAWLSQEWNRTRRTKLEEYVEEIKSLPERLEIAHQPLLYGSAQLSPPLIGIIARAEMLQSLFFRELVAEQNAVSAAVTDYHHAGLGVRAARLSRRAPNEPLENVVMTPAETAAYSQAFVPLIRAIERATQAATRVMEDLVGEEQ